MTLAERKTGIGFCLVLEHEMARATLTFTLPDEEPEHRAALQGAEAKRVLWEIDQRLRSVLKHADPSDDTARLAEEIRSMIRQSPERLLDE